MPNPVVISAPLSVGAMAEYPDTQNMRARFVRMSRFGDQVVMWRSGKGGNILVPRAICMTACSNATKDLRMEGVEVDFECEFTPRNDQQVRVINETYNLLLDEQSFVVECPTGFGKTAVMMPVIANLGVRTLVVVHKADLVDRWLEDIEKILKIKPEDVGLIKQDQYDVAGRDIVLAFCQSVWKPGKYPDWVFDQFGLVIYDEIHRFPTEKFQSAMGMIPAKLRVGLSATPERVDGREFVITAHIGGVMVKAVGLPMIPKVLVLDSEWKCPKWKRYNPKSEQYEWREVDHSGGKIGHVIKHMANDPVRNKLICECAYTAWEAGRHTVVMCDTLAHLETVRIGLRAMGVPRHDMAFYVGGMTAEERDFAKGQLMILATYKMMQEGTDIPWLSALVMGTPKAHVKQIIGRVCREYEGKPEPVVFDIRDHSKEFKRYAMRRRQVYAELGATVKMMN